MTRLTIALTEALYWRMAWHDSNAAVGMGPSIPWVLDQLLAEMKIEVRPSIKRKAIGEVIARRAEKK